MKKFLKRKIIICLLTAIVCLTFIPNNTYAKENLSCIGKIVPKEEVYYHKPAAVKSLEKPTGVKVYRSTEASMVEFLKVENADYYKIYRKQGKRKWLYLGRVNESDFFSSTIFKHVRQFVDIRYKYSKKKSSVNYKKKAYKYNKNYRYKVVAVNRKVKSKGTVVYSKKWKRKKAELSYYTLYRANKIRKGRKRNYVTWGHHFEKGSLIRAKEMVKQSEKPRSKWHFRPNGWSWVNAYKYINKYTEVDPETNKKGYPTLFAENVGVSYSGCTSDIIDSYMKSEGHMALFTLKNQDEPGSKGVMLGWNGEEVWAPPYCVVRDYFSLTAATYCKNLTRDNDVYHEMTINDEPYIVD